MRCWLDEDESAVLDHEASRAPPGAVPAVLATGPTRGAAAARRSLPGQAASVKAAAFDAGRFRQVLDDIRPLSRKAPFGGVFRQLQSMCAEAGVVVVRTPELTGTHLSGAARWIGTKALIQLSLRHKSDDQFWFTFFHEAGHLLTRKRRRDFIDGVDVTDPDTAADEEAANEFARNVLVPSDEYERFVARGDFGAPAVRAFAESLSVSPGIVAGRLERDRHLTPAQARPHKQTIRYPTTA